jgi:hypothetical protein
LDHLNNLLFIALIKSIDKACEGALIKRADCITKKVPLEHSSKGSHFESGKQGRDHPKQPAGLGNLEAAGVVMTDTFLKPIFPRGRPEH